MAMENSFTGLGIAHIVCGLITLLAQIAIISLNELGEGLHIGTGIWIGIAFIITGGLTIAKSASSVTFRKVMLIISMIFAIFLSFWAFIAAIIHWGQDLWDDDDDYRHERWLRVTQGFCGLFELAISIVTLCQRTPDQEGRVIASGPQAQTMITVQPGVPAAGIGYATSGQVITYQQPPPQVVAYPQSVVANQGYPPPYPGQVYQQK